MLLLRHVAVIVGQVPVPAVVEQSSFKAGHDPEEIALRSLVPNAHFAKPASKAEIVYSVAIHIGRGGDDRAPERAD